MQSIVIRLILLGGLAAVLSGCSSDGMTLDAVSGGAQPIRRPEQPENAAAALARAEELRAAGKPVQALARLADAHRRFPLDAGVVSAYGRVAVLLGHDELAAPLLAQAVAANPRDWRALSAQGVLESRRGRHADGRRALIKATMISASEAVLLNNLAVSHLLEGKPAAAASLLRQGLASPELRPEYEQRLKRNLGLALAVQGRFDEADRLAGETLPRDLAGADGRRLRRLLGVSETQLASGDGWKAQLANSVAAQAKALR
jgi:Flp pilus assembly protein TadD